MKKREIKQLEGIFKLYSEIKLVYFFGSKATGEGGPLSDHDFAFYLDEKDPKKVFDIKFKLQDKISRMFKTDKIDVVILGLNEAPELKYNIIKEGILIYEKEPYKILVEPRILNEYFDFRALLLKHNLTRV